MDNRPEPRTQSDLTVRIWGMGSNGRAFFQNVRADNISSDGALFSGVEHPLVVGDVIGVQVGEKKARAKVVWVIEAGPVQKSQVGVQLLENQPCPWEVNLPTLPDRNGTGSAGHDKRRFYRHRLRFPIEILDERHGPAMQTSATDISGRGCYVETMIPLPFGTKLRITFWLNEEKISTTGIVRASDPGVGMGIEFTSLPMDTQQRLQDWLEKNDPGFASASSNDAPSGLYPPPPPKN